MPHSAEELDVNESLIAGEETLNETRAHVGAVYTWEHMPALSQLLHTHTNTHAADETLTPLRLKYYPDILLHSTPPSLSIHSSHPPCDERQAHSVLQQD